MKSALLAARQHVASLLAAQDTDPSHPEFVPDMELLTAQTALRQMEDTFESQFGPLPAE